MEYQVCACICTNVCVCVNLYKCVCVYVCACIRKMCLRLFVCMCLYERVRACVRVCSRSLTVPLRPAARRSERSAGRRPAGTWWWWPGLCWPGPLRCFWRRKRTTDEPQRMFTQNKIKKLHRITQRASEDRQGNAPRQTYKDLSIIFEVQVQLFEC